MIRNVKVKDIEFRRGRPVVCVPVSGSTFSEVVNEIKSAAGADIIEWRCDFFTENVFDFLPQVHAACGNTPLLVTCRSKREGGKADVTEERYAEVVEMLIASGEPDLIDIEFSSPYSKELIALAKENNIITVVSAHDFEKTAPEEELIALLNAMEAAGADIPKLAQMPQNFRDTLNLISATEKVSQYNFPIITMSMGKFGKISRLCGEFSGSALTFGAAENASAPGQVELGFLNKILDELHK